MRNNKSVEDIGSEGTIKILKEQPPGASKKQKAIFGQGDYTLTIEYGNHYNYIEDKTQQNYNYHWTAFVRLNSTEYNIRDIIDHATFELEDK